MHISKSILLSYIPIPAKLCIPVLKVVAVNALVYVAKDDRLALKDGARRLAIKSCM